LTSKCRIFAEDLNHPRLDFIYLSNNF
jgi:hypothetical protein